MPEWMRGIERLVEGRLGPGSDSGREHGRLPAKKLLNAKGAKERLAKDAKTKGCGAATSQARNRRPAGSASWFGARRILPVC